MMKKMVSLLLTAALAVGTLAGCGSAETGAKGDAGSASNGSVFKIGGIGPTTGAAALYGLAVQRGAQIAVDEINEAGGINGVKIEYKRCSRCKNPAKFFEDDFCGNCGAKLDLPQPPKGE